MTSEQLEKLKKLENHIRSGVLAHRYFNMGAWNSTSEGGIYQKSIVNIPYCGTAGCAYGELPVIFPDDFKFINASSAPHFSGKFHFNEPLNPYIIAMEYFGIEFDEAQNIFNPVNYGYEFYEEIPREAVADSIFEVIQKYEGANS